MITSYQKIDFKEHTLIERVVVDPPFRMAHSLSNDACFVYFKAGETKINSAYQQVQVRQKEAVLLKCGTYFSDLIDHEATEAYEIFVFHFPVTVIREIYQSDFPILDDLDQKKGIPKLESSEIIHQFVSSLTFYFNHPQLVNEELLTLKIKELILILIQTGKAPTIKDLFITLYDNSTIQLKEVVYNHLYTNVPIKDLAFLCNMSLSTFNRQFKKIFKDQPSNYFKEKRLVKAKELLSISELSIARIAHETCFTDSAHLSKSFKQQFGISPSAFRKSRLT